jgi:hypothetical protein
MADAFLGIAMNLHQLVIASLLYACTQQTRDDEV